MGISWSPAVNRLALKTHTRTHAPHKPRSVSLSAPSTELDSASRLRVEAGEVCTASGQYLHIITHFREARARVTGKTYKWLEGWSVSVCLRE